MIVLLTGGSGCGKSTFAEHIVASLPEEMRTSAEEYAKRLEICQNCEAKAGNLCSLCGCFVRARAAKKNMRCPHPAGRKW